MREIKEIVRVGLQEFEITEINVIKKLEETKLKLMKVDVKERIKENLEKIEMKTLKYETIALEKNSQRKIIEVEEAKREINERERGKMEVLGIRIRSRVELEKLQIKRINKVKKLKLSPYRPFISS